MNRLPIRVRLTAAFASAMLLMLTGAFLFVYLRLRADIDDRVHASLRAHADVVASQIQASRLVGVALEDPEESFVQLLDRDGRLLDTAGADDQPALPKRDLARAGSHDILVESDVVGVDGRARMLVRRIGIEARSQILVVGVSLRDRNDALSNVVTSFVAGGGIAVLLASVVGFFLARAGLAPVERMRRRASAISRLSVDEQLPLPSAHDEIFRLAATLNEMLVRLQASFEREARFVADASHELRTPIAVIKTELEGVLRSGEGGEQTHEALVAAVEECDRLAELADDLLVLARTGDGQLPIRAEAFNVATLLQGVRDRFLDRAGQRGRAIRVEGDRDLIGWADVERLRQALSNLVDNALRHGLGVVTLCARETQVGLDIDTGDEGEGFSEEFATHAFERFTRGDHARSSDGAGLGLAIVAAIAEAHGGTAIIVRDGAHTVVRMSLPRD